MLIRYISQNAAIKAGFTWPVIPSMSMVTQDSLYKICHSYIQKRNLNILVIERLCYNNSKTELYFARLSASNLAEKYITDREATRKQLIQLAKRKNRIAASNLETILLKVVK